MGPMRFQSDGTAAHFYGEKCCLKSRLGNDGVFHYLAQIYITHQQYEFETHITSYLRTPQIISQLKTLEKFTENMAAQFKHHWKLIINKQSRQV